MFGTIIALVCCCAVKKPTNKQTNKSVAVGGAESCVAVGGAVVAIREAMVGERREVAE